MTSRPKLEFCTCSSSLDNVSEFPDIEKFLPTGYKYSVCNWEKADAEHFECRFRVNIRKIAETELWLQKFSYRTNTDFKKGWHRKCKDAYVAAFRCGHTTTDPPQKYKNVNFLLSHQNLCPTRLVIIVKYPEFENMYRNDIHLHEFPMTVIYHLKHNHFVESRVEIVDDSQMIFTDLRNAISNVADADDWLINETAFELKSSLDIMKKFSDENATNGSDENSINGSDENSINESDENATSECDGYDKTYYEVLESNFPRTHSQGDFLLTLENAPFVHIPDEKSYSDYFVTCCLLRHSFLKNASEERDYGSFQELYGVESPLWPPVLPEILVKDTE